MAGTSVVVARYCHVRRSDFQDHLLAADPRLCRGRDLACPLGGLRARAPSGVTMLELYEQQVAGTKRMNATLERIAAIMEKRPLG
jgi:hypothetical protein